MIGLNEDNYYLKKGAEGRHLFIQKKNNKLGIGFAFSFVLYLLKKKNNHSRCARRKIETFFSEYTKWRHNASCTIDTRVENK